MYKQKLTSTAAAFALFASLALAQDDSALLDLLIKKKVISQEEAEKVRADLIKENTAAEKLKVAPWVQEMNIGGDMKMRFEYQNSDPQIAPTVSSPIAGTLGTFQGNKTPIFLPDTKKGAFFRNQNGDFKQLDRSTQIPTVVAGVATKPGYIQDALGNTRFVKKGDSVPTDFAPVSALFDRISGGHTFFFAGAGAANYNYYRDNSGNFVKLAPGQAVPAAVTDKTTYARISNQQKGNTGSQQDRWRFRLLLHDDFKLADNMFGGVELATSSSSDGYFQTYGGKDTGSGIGGGGFDKYGIFISKAYFGWNMTDWAKVVIGKQADPFYTTDLVWDPDINPDGLVEVMHFDKMPFFDNSEASYAKDGKSVPPTPLPWELALNMGQFIFSDNIENGLTLSEPGFADHFAHHDYSNDAYLFEFQLQASYKFTKTVKATFAPAFMFYNSARVSGANNVTPFTDVGAVTTNLNRRAQFLGETRDLQILTAPGDVSFKLGGLPVKVYWDFAYNFEGKKRDENIYGLFFYNGSNKVTSFHSAQDDLAWLAGIQVGQNKKAGDWSLNGNFRQTGMAAVDPNLNDSDFALGKLNTQGFKVAATYNFTDFCTGAVTYFYAWNLRSDLIGGQATSGSSLANQNNVQVLYVDLQVKF